jgi:hypothetical protein
MSRRSGEAARWSRRVVVSAVLALCGCAALPPTGSVVIPNIPPGMARAWFYREDLPYNGMARPYVRMNGAVVGVAELGGAFYRDVSPGEYYVTADSYGVDINQFPRATLTAGQTAYFQVISSRYWASGSASTTWTRPTFYIWLMPPAVAWPAIAASPFYAGGS